MLRDAIEDLTLPLSRLHLQWRPTDALCRIIKDGYARHSDIAALFDWAPVTGQSKFVGTYRVEQNQTSVVFGERPVNATVEVIPHAAAEVHSYAVGPLWAAEWIGAPGDVTVRWSDTSESLTVAVGHPADYLA